LNGGAAGGGKSFALLMEALIRSIEHPGHQSLLLRKSYPELERSLIRESQKNFPKDICSFKSNKKSWEFDNGSVIDFGYIQHRHDVYNFQSGQWDYIGFDELTQFEEFMYTYLLSRLRTTSKDIQPVMRAATNPGNIGHQWVKRRFVDPAEPYEIWTTEQGMTRQFIPATVYDNPYLLENDPGYIEKLKSLPEEEQKALLEGNWNVFAGQVFKEFDHKTHVIQPFQIPVEWTKYMALDWGFVKPFCVLWGAVDPEQRVYIYREYYGCRPNRVNVGIEMNARDVAAHILDMEREPVQIRVADPATWQKRGHDGLTISEIMAQEGVPMMKADNDRMQGKMAVHDRLRVARDGEPMIYFFDNCKNIIRTLPALTYDARKTEDVDDSQEDHAYDALRYLLMARPIKTERGKPSIPRDPVTGY